MFYLVLLLVFLIFVFIVSYILTDQDILAPSNTMCMMFILSVLFALMNYKKWEIDFLPETFAILSTGVFVFCASTVGFKYIFLRKQKINSSFDFDWKIAQPKMSIIIFFILLNSLVCLWYYKEIVRFVGISGLDFRSLVSSYRRIRVNNLANGSSSDAVNGILSQFLKVVKASGHVAVFFLVNSSRFEKKMKLRHKIGYLIIILLSFVPSIFVASRGEFLKFISFTLIIVYISWQQKYEWKKVLSWKIIRIGIIGVAIGIPLFYYSAELIGRSNTSNVLDYVSTYIGGSIQLFNLYVKDPIPSGIFGEESLIGISKILSFLGLSEMSSSTNLEFRMLGEYRSNVYTFFRRPFHDFGLLGMYLFTVFIALLFSYIYFAKIKNKRRNQSVDRWVLVYGNLYYWLILSSIDQYSQSYISVGALLIIILIVFEYDLIVRL